MQNEPFQTSTATNFKDTIKNFYKNYKIYIYTFIVLLFIISSSIIYYLDSKQKKHLLMSDLYIKAKIELSKGKKNEAKNILLKIINEDNSTYSPLSLFLIVNFDLIEDDQKLIELFEHVLQSNKFDEEIKNLIIFKKTIIQSNYLNEAELLKALAPLINSKSLWKSHAHLLLGDYFVSKGENLKAKENYIKILSLQDEDNLHETARQRLQID